MLKVFSTGRPDTGSWYRIWQATEATYAVCTKAARFGSFRGLGKSLRVGMWVIHMTDAVNRRQRWYFRYVDCGPVAEVDD